MTATNPAEEPVPPPPTLHEAEMAAGPSGAVLWGIEITLEEAIERRKSGLDIVVRGSDQIANRRAAQAVESGIGEWTGPHFPHRRHAGPRALPHFHQRTRSPGGHSFYELNQTKATKKP